MKEVIRQIIEAEWAMMDRVQNHGGRADCQDDRETFILMRCSQLEVWTVPLAESYLRDLFRAQNEGRNLLTEKYAYMMVRTAPSEFAALRSKLSQPSDEKLSLAKKICQIQTAWQEKLAERYPYLALRGRRIRKEEDQHGRPSFETYLLGELLTYSEETLRLYDSYMQNLRQKGENLCEQVLEQMVHRYGYSSPEAAEQQLRYLYRLDC